jgi:hypothetical protein
MYARQVRGGQISSRLANRGRSRFAVELLEGSQTGSIPGGSNILLKLQLL